MVGNSVSPHPAAALVKANMKVSVRSRILSKIITGVGRG